MSIDTLAKYARAFGYGKRMGINLPHEQFGLIPTKEWKQKRFGEPWQKGETLSCVIGQSFVLATPLQLAVSYAAIANGGKIMKPMLVKEIFSNGGKIYKRNEPEVKSTVSLRQSTLDIVRRGLYEVANSPGGTVWWRRGVGLELAGKTGTSQVIRMSAEKLFAKCSEKPMKNRHHGLFVGYAPNSKPEISASAVVEYGCSGSSAAAPIVVAIIDEYMKKYQKELQFCRLNSLFGFFVSRAGKTQP